MNDLAENDILESVSCPRLRIDRNYHDLMDLFRSDVMNRAVTGKNGSFAGHISSKQNPRSNDHRQMNLMQSEINLHIYASNAMLYDAPTYLLT